jgi:hypothetical protein
MQPTGSNLLPPVLNTRRCLCREASLLAGAYMHVTILLNNNLFHCPPHNIFPVAS